MKFQRDSGDAGGEAGIGAGLRLAILPWLTLVAFAVAVIFGFAQIFRTSGSQQRTTAGLLPETAGEAVQAAAPSSRRLGRIKTWTDRSHGNFSDTRRPWSERLDAARELAARGAFEDWRLLVREFLRMPPELQEELGQMLVATDRELVQKLAIAVLESGSDREAVGAIRLLGLLGGEANEIRLADILRDDAWPDVLRREAAIALLEQASTKLSRAAIHGLSTLATEQDAALLAAILNSPDWPEAMRMLAAAGLGGIPGELACNALLGAFRETTDLELQVQLLAPLGRRPFAGIEPLWMEILESPSSPPELRSTAAEALAYGSVEAVPLLERLTTGDPDPEVREMAAWALAAHPPGEQMGAQLAEWVRAEPEPDVRRRLYEAALLQASNPAAELLPQIRVEDDPAARVAALNALGDAVGRGAAPALEPVFDREMIPELLAIAESNWSLNLRMRAVFALRRAGTPAAIEALQTISRTQTPEISIAARNGLQQHTKP